MNLKVRRLSDLVQLPDGEFLGALGEGAAHALRNAERLYTDACAALESGGRRGYLMLRNAAAEEAAKALILLDAARCPTSEGKRRGRQLWKFYDHLSRMIYNEVCGYHPRDFRELERLIGQLREEYYLDGPNGFDWIYRNRLLQDRESLMYVDYVEVDDGRRWEVPNEALIELLTQGPPIPPGGLRIAGHLREVGLLTKEGMAIAAEVWRGTTPESDMPWATFRNLSAKMLERLESAELLGDAEPLDVATIRDDLPFPLWSVDTTLIEVKFEDTRAAREALAAKYPGDY